MSELFGNIGTAPLLILALAAFLIGINKTAVPGIGPSHFTAVFAWAR